MVCERIHGKFSSSLRVKILFIFIFFIFFLLTNVLANPVIEWNTFLGSSGQDYGQSVATDGSGNVYTAGESDATWGTPIRPYGGVGDVAVAKFDANGVLQWNTFLGTPDSNDYNASITTDSSGNTYVTGTSNMTWGTPVNPHSGGANVFLAKIDSSGILLWNTFIGGYSGPCYSGPYHSIMVDGSGNSYLTGYSYNWGTPVNPHAGAVDVFVAKLNSSGVLQWNTFLGHQYNDDNPSLTIDAPGNVYVAGNSQDTWGTPINPHSGDYNGFVAKLNVNGILQWNTFLPSLIRSIAADGIDGLYVTGNSSTTWGTPINPLPGYVDVFVAKFNTSGVLQWNTFLGSSSGRSYGNSITTIGNENIFLLGVSQANWGTPINPYTGAVGTYAGFVAKLNGSGVLQWNTYLEQTNEDGYRSIAADDSGGIYVAGYSLGSWGTPVNPWTSYRDISVVKLYDTDFDDTTPPTVNSTSPLGGASDVPVDAKILVTFSEAMDVATINSSSYTVNDGAGNIAGTIAYNGVVATFTPSSALDYNTTYTATITTDVEDLDGNVLATVYTWSFTTAPLAAAISGAPEISTISTSAILTVGGTGVVAYKYRLDTGSYSAEIPVGTQINLSGLAEGSHAVTVIGKDSAGNWQSKASATTVLWTVGHPPSLAAGLYHSVALKPDGTVWTWGFNRYGALGDGNYMHESAHTTTPTIVPGVCDAIAVAAGWHSTYAIASDGSVWAWGRNNYYQLGNGTNTDTSTPAKVSGLTNVVALAAGDEHALALKTDGTVWSWGMNEFGQLGDGTKIDRATPVQVSGLANITAIAAGSHHNLAISSNGSVWAWGYNGSGGLGDGTFDSRSSPIQIMSLTNMAAIAAGYGHSVALKSDGTLLAWGTNNYGQCGINSTGWPNSPVA